MTKVIVFDLDGTSSTSKKAIDDDRGRLFTEDPHGQFEYLQRQRKLE